MSCRTVPRGYGAMAAVIAASLTAGAAVAVADDTVALYTFDTMGGNSNAVPTDLVLFDTSGSGLDFVSTTNFGTTYLSTDLAGLMPPLSLSLDSNSGGGRSFSTPASTDLHRGATGELTVEFWWKSISLPASFGYVMSFDGGNGAANTGDWGIYSTSTGNLRFFEYSSAAFPEVAVGSAASNGDWNHVAFSINDTGVMTSYLNGLMVNQTAATGPAAAPFADVLKFGRSTGDTFASHHFRIDDLRISNVALLPGNGTGVGELAWDAPLSLAPVVPPRPADFGRQWVRQNPFTITAWGFTSHPDLYTEANFNAALGGEYEAVNNAGVMPMFLGAMTTLNDQTRTRVQIALSAGVKAFLLRDELPTNEIAGFKEVADYIRSVDSESLIIVGLGASSPPYVDDVITGTNPDAVIHGFYPFTGTTNATDRWYVGGLDDVAIIRERALFYDVPYFAFIQSFEDFDSGLNPPDFARRLPSESELRAELFSKLSAGVKGFAYFVFQDGVYEDIALVDPSGVKSSLYAPAAAANQEIATLGTSMRFLESSDWRFVSGGVASTPAYMTAWDASAGFGKLLNVVVNGTPADRRDALVGLFLDDDGGEYFMIVNTYHGTSLTAEDAEVTISLTFDDSIDTIWRLNRLTGEVEQLLLTNHMLDLTLPGGTGDLFSFTGSFPIPEPTTLAMGALGIALLLTRRRVHDATGPTARSQS